MTGPSGTNQVITESEIETLCDRALDKAFKNITFMLSVIGDDVKEYVRDYYGVEPRQKSNNNGDQTDPDETSDDDAASKSLLEQPESSDTRSDSHFQQPASGSSPSVEITRTSRGIIRQRILRRLNGAARRHRPCFPTGAAASTRLRLQRMVIDRLLEREIRKALLDNHSSSEGGSVASMNTQLLGHLSQVAFRPGLRSSEGEYSEIKKALLNSHSSSVGKGGDGVGSMNAECSGYQGQDASPLDLSASEGQEKDCGQRNSEERSDCRFQNTFVQSSSPEGGSENSRTGGAVAKRPDCMFQKIPKPFSSPEKSTTTGIANWLLPQDSKSDDNSPDGDPDRVIVERLSYPF